MKGFLVGGTASGVGKTTVALALIAAMRSRGRVVQAFKGGPDFLDTGHLTRATGRAARTVDTWMLEVEANRRLVRSAARGADAVVVEGMMGLFDGKDGQTEAGSSAEIAKLLGLPVVLVVDAGKSARSVAAVVLGFEMFDPELRMEGVVLNRVAGERHYGMLKEAIEARCATPVLGWMAREAGVAIPERHLGLVGAEEMAAGAEERGRLLGEMAERTVDVGRAMGFVMAMEMEPGSASIGASGLLVPEEIGDCGEVSDEAWGASMVAALRMEPAGELSSLLPEIRMGDGERDQPVRIGVARDGAFSFYYEDNLDALREAGAELVEFSPVADGGLPEGVDGIYLGGGYPELYAGQLRGNEGMLAAVRAFAQAGGVIYAECGGMLYLGHALTTMDGVRHGMAGVLAIETEMTERLVKFGYVTVTLTEDCLLGRKGTEVRGHSFHHSRMLEGTGAEELGTAYRVAYSMSGMEEAEGFRRGGVLASYVHLHFGARAGIAEGFVAWVRAARERRLGKTAGLCEISLPGEMGGDGAAVGTVAAMAAEGMGFVAAEGGAASTAGLARTDGAGLEVGARRGVTA